MHIWNANKLKIYLFFPNVSYNMELGMAPDIENNVNSLNVNNIISVVGNQNRWS